MFKYFKELVKDSFIYSLSSILPKAVGFFLIPIYTRFLTPQDYGILSIVSLITSIATIFLRVGQNASVTRFYYDELNKKDKSRYKILLGNILMFLLIFNGLVIFLLSKYGEPIFLFLFKSPDLKFDPYIKLGLYTIFFGIPFGILTNLLRAKRKPKFYSILQILKFLLATSLIIYFVVFLRQGALGSIKGGLYAALAFFVLSLLFLKREVILKFNFKRLKEALKFGIPLAPHQLLSWVTNFFDKYLLERFTTLSIVGLYTLGYKFGLVINLVAGSIGSAWGPFYYEIMSSEKESKKIISKLTTIVTVGITIIGLGIVLFSKEVIKIMATEKFLSAYMVIPPVVASYVLFGTKMFLVTGIFYLKRTKIIPFITLIVGATNVLLNIIMIPFWGMLGAAYATLISAIVSYIISYYYSNKIFPMPFETKKLLSLYILFFTTYFVSIFLNIYNFSILAGIFIKGLLFILFVFSLILFKVIELKDIRNLWKRLRTKFL